jgi:hypothetical protein
VEALKNGDSVTLIHRSEVVGVINPPQPEPKRFDPEAFQKAIDKLNLPKTSYKQREKNYRAHLEAKYGKAVPRR